MLKEGMILRDFKIFRNRYFLILFHRAGRPLKSTSFDWDLLFRAWHHLEHFQQKFWSHRLQTKS